MLSTEPESIRVVTEFHGKTVRPLAFQRAGRRYDVEKVNLIYRKRNGARWLWCFAVSDAANAYLLVFNPDDLTWQLEAVNEGG
jgi:hypothetical protein